MPTKTTKTTKTKTYDTATHPDDFAGPPVLAAILRRAVGSSRSNRPASEIGAPYDRYSSPRREASRRGQDAERPDEERQVERGRCRAISAVKPPRRSGRPSRVRRSETLVEFPPVLVALLSNVLVRLNRSPVLVLKKGVTAKPVLAASLRLAMSAWGLPAPFHMSVWVLLGLCSTARGPRHSGSAPVVVIDRSLNS
jgi:hypothetical protein